MLNRLPLSSLLMVALVALSMACGEKEEVQKEPPAYARADYTMSLNDGLSTEVRFTDITESAGIDFVHETGAFGEKWMPETMGSGGGFLDYDGDGRPDIFLVNSRTWPGHETPGNKATPKLYRNLGNGKFADVTAEAGLDFSIYGMGCAFADYDADGDLDIYLTAVGDNKLLRNDGGRFVDVARQLGVVGNSEEPGEPLAWSTSVAWVDVDRDGWLDLFVCNYVKWTPETDLFTTLDGKTKSYATPEQYQGETCRLYRNVRGQRFENFTRESGVYNPEGKSLGVAVADFNDDGWPDIMVANDTQPNFLYMNRGDGTFEDVALRAGVGYDELGRARAGMGIDVADFDNDGSLSVAIGNFSREPLSLYTQIGDELFQDLAGKARLTRNSLLQLTFGLLFVDLNLDGYQDLVVGNGHIEPEINRVQQDITFAQPPQVFLNDTRGHFIDASDKVGEDFVEPIVARGLASADIDDGGDPDLLLTINGGPAKLLRNDLPSKASRWVKFRLRGEPPNLDAIGAAVTVWTGDVRQTQLLRTGSSYLSQSDIGELIFGLGSYARADSVHVRWPTTGRVDRLGPAAADRTYVIREAQPRLMPQ